VTFILKKQKISRTGLYYIEELINDYLDPYWNLIVGWIELEMKKYFKKYVICGDYFALFELHQYCNKVLCPQDQKNMKKWSC